MQTLSWNEFTANVQQWATERGIYEHSTPDAQALKTLSEIGEMADSIIKGNIDRLKDDIGDTCVCLVNYAAMKGIDLDESAVWDGSEEGEDMDKEISARYVAGLSTVTASLIDGMPKREPENTLVYMAFMLALIIAQSNGLGLLDCCTHAWETIKDRKGKMVAGGAFVKDEE